MPKGSCGQDECNTRCLEFYPVLWNAHRFVAALTAAPLPLSAFGLAGAGFGLRHCTALPLSLIQQACHSPGWSGIPRLLKSLGISWHRPDWVVLCATVCAHEVRSMDDSA